jgi:hypothetical protein
MVAATKLSHSAFREFQTQLEMSSDRLRLWKLAEVETCRESQLLVIMKVVHFTVLGCPLLVQSAGAEGG